MARLRLILRSNTRFCGGYRANQRLYLYAKLTENAVKSLQKPTDPIDVNHLTINVLGTPMSAGNVTLRDQSIPVRSAVDADRASLAGNEPCVLTFVMHAAAKAVDFG